MKTDGVLAVEGPVVQATGADPDRLVQRRIDIDVRSGLIRSVGDPTGDANLVLGPDYVILPGIIDVHVHAREDPSGQDCYKETFETAGAAGTFLGRVPVACAVAARADPQRVVLTGGGSKAILRH